jgi:hypothetical protein
MIVISVAFVDALSVFLSTFYGKLTNNETRAMEPKLGLWFAASSVYCSLTLPFTDVSPALSTSRTG